MKHPVNLQKSVIRWQRAFFILLGIEILLAILIVPPLIANTRPDIFYQNAFTFTKPIKPSLDTDRDGLPDDLEIKHGSNPNLKDTDGDGLSDYEEVFKYHTNPTKQDSDEDGIPDIDWNERREFTYTIQAIVDLRPPFRLEDMNDFYQDARVIAQTDAEVTRLEVILYPKAKNILNPSPYPVIHSKPAKPTYTKNYNHQMKKELYNITKSAKTDLEAIGKILKYFSQYKHLDLEADLLHFGPLPYFMIHRDRQGHIVAEGEAVTVDWNSVLQKQIFATGMFKYKVHGDCGSTSIIRGALIRAAGIPERTIMTIPLFFSYDSDRTVIRVKPEYRRDEWLNMDSKNTFMADHFYNEALIGNRWIRVDNGIDNATGISDKIKLLTFADSTDYNLFIYGDSDNYHQKRPYRYLSIIEQEAKNR